MKARININRFIILLAFIIAGRIIVTPVLALFKSE